MFSFKNLATLALVSVGATIAVMVGAKILRGGDANSSESCGCNSRKQQQRAHGLNASAAAEA